MLVNSLNSVEKYKLRDEGFAVQNAVAFELCIELSDKHLSLAVLDKKDNKFLAVEQYLFNTVYTSNTLAQSILTFFSEHDFAKSNFKKVVVSYVGPKFTLVPKVLFEANQKQNLFDFSNKKDASLDVKHNNINSVDAVLIFGIPQVINSVLMQLFPNAEIKNSLGTFIETCFKHRDVSFTSEVFVNFYNSIVYIVVIKNGKLLLCNAYSVQTPQDALYFISLQINHFQLEGTNFRINIAGDIDTNNDVFVELQKFSYPFSFSKLPSTIDFSFKLKTVPEHYFVNLYNVLLCE